MTATRVSAGVDDRARIAARDAPDGDQRLAGEGAGGAHAIETDYGIGIRLAAVANTGPMAR